MNNENVMHDDDVTRVMYSGSVTASRKYNVYVATHPGRVRSHNEDNFAVNSIYRHLEDAEKRLKGLSIDEPMFCAVFDGMGGEANGDLASKICAELSTSIYDELYAGVPVDVNAMVSRFVVRSNSGVVEMLDNNKAKRGGSTCVLTVFYNGAVYPFSLGDSRIYLYRDRKLTQISYDQTLAMKKLRANIITEEEALTTPDRHKLTSFVGVDVDGEGLEPQIYQPFILRPGDKLLLCSDGLYDMCTDDQIALLLNDRSSKACLDLVEAALKNGGEDNVTCLIVECA